MVSKPGYTQLTIVIISFLPIGDLERARWWFRRGEPPYPSNPNPNHVIGWLLRCETGFAASYLECLHDPLKLGSLPEVMVGPTFKGSWRLGIPLGSTDRGVS